MARGRGQCAFVGALAALLPAALLLAGCQAGPQGLAQSPPPQPVSPGPAEHAAGHSQTATLVVHGMGCPLCANNVDKQLLKVAGVEKVNVDLGSGKVKVSFASGVTRPGDDKLAKAVANSGYTLVRIQTP